MGFIDISLQDTVLPARWVDCSHFGDELWKRIFRFKFAHSKHTGGLWGPFQLSDVLDHSYRF